MLGTTTTSLLSALQLQCYRHGGNKNCDRTIFQSNLYSNLVKVTYTKAPENMYEHMLEKGVPLYYFFRSEAKVFAQKASVIAQKP